jgi:hypothetical protein
MVAMFFAQSEGPFQAIKAAVHSRFGEDPKLSLRSVVERSVRLCHTFKR